MSTAPSIDAYVQDLPEHHSERDRRIGPLVRRYLAAVREYLVELHRSGAPGRVVNEANSDLTDGVVHLLFNLAEQSALADGAEPEDGLAAVAVGGYARREMSLYSDVDLLVLYRDQLSPFVTSIAEHVQHWLWDAGLTVGFTTRTIEDTVELASRDNSVQTGVLTVRFLYGNGKFFERFADSIRARLLPDLALFVEEQEKNMRERHARYGESLFLLQPDLKQGAGALRDYHTAYWVARGTLPEVREAEDFFRSGLLTESEGTSYRAALDFLWRVRNELHYSTGRADDRMSFELQESVAEALGYGVAAADSNQLPVERFMGDYYRHARAIGDYSQLVIEQCRRRVASPRRRAVREVEQGFRVLQGQLEIPHAAHLRERPLRMLAVFEIARRHGVRLSRMAQRLLRENLYLIDDEFRRNPEAMASFLRILESKTQVLGTLATMNEVGLLGAYLPEWENIVFRWQHVLYHTYTVDVHSIFLVEELRRLMSGRYAKALPDLTELMQAVRDRPVLYLGCMLHDIGKGLGGDHSIKGVSLARSCVERLGLEEERRERVVFLVRHHLLMAELAQRRDLSDPRLILEFGKICGDRTNLRHLYLLTFADIRASSRDAWTPWKGSLLRELYERTGELLESDRKNQARVLELIEKQVEKRKEGARRELRGLGVAENRIQSYFEDMPRRYFVSHTPRQMARHAGVAFRYFPERILSTAFRHMIGESTEFILCTAHSYGLYSQVTGTLTVCNINILGSHVYATRTGLALQIYRLTTPSGGREEIQLAWSNLERTLTRVLSGEARVDELLRRRRLPVGKARPPAAPPPRVVVSNRESEFYTIVDVSANDRIGLLYDLTRCIGDLDLEIYISKASTIRDQVADTFYVKDRERRKIRDPELLSNLERALTAAVRRGEGGTDD